MQEPVTARHCQLWHWPIHTSTPSITYSKKEHSFLSGIYLPIFAPLSLSFPAVNKNWLNILSQETECRLWEIATGGTRKSWPRTQQYNGTSSNDTSKYKEQPPSCMWKKTNKTNLCMQHLCVTLRLEVSWRFAQLKKKQSQLYMPLSQILQDEPSHALQDEPSHASYSKFCSSHTFNARRGTDWNINTPIIHPLHTVSVNLSSLVSELRRRCN